MEWGSRRQLLIMLGVLGLIAIIGGSIFYRLFFSVEPSCFDGRLNGAEANVDCGGTCMLQCRDDIRPLVTLWTQALPIQNNVYTLVAYVENQNTGVGIRELEYRFVSYDDADQVIVERAGVTSIPPNQRVAIIEPRVAMDTIPQWSFFEIIGGDNYEKVSDRFTTAQLIVSAIDYETTARGGRVTAALQNIALIDIVETDVVALAYDNLENVIGVSSTYIDHIRAGTSKDVVFTWPNRFSSEPTRIEIIPNPDVFSPSNAIAQ